MVRTQRNNLGAGRRKFARTETMSGKGGRSVREREREKGARDGGWGGS